MKVAILAEVNGEKYRLGEVEVTSIDGHLDEIADALTALAGYIKAGRPECCEDEDCYGACSCDDHECSDGIVRPADAY